MSILKYFYTSLFSLACLSPLAAQQTNPPSLLAPSGTQMVAIGDPNNNADELGHGAVTVAYQLGTFEWTVQDWKSMLDDVASQPDAISGAADVHGLWNAAMTPWITRAGSSTTGYTYTVVNGTENLPITNVSFDDCCRACNYTQNKGNLPLAAGISIDSITEHGAYKITKNVDGTETATVSAKAKFTIPSEDQWVKAAFYKSGNSDAGYWMYATRSDTNPGDAAGKLLNNRANYDLHSLSPHWLTGAPLLALTDVDALGTVDGNGNYTGTYSPYGCFDMAGNVNEWTSTTDATQNNIVRGGSYASEYSLFTSNYLMRTVTPESFSAETRSNTLGFRMAAVAVPADSSSPSTGGPSATVDSSKWYLGKHWDQLSTGEQETIAPVVGAALVAGGLYAAGINVGTMTYAGIRTWLAGTAVDTSIGSELAISSEAGSDGAANEGWATRSCKWIKSWFVKSSSPLDEDV